MNYTKTILIASFVFLCNLLYAQTEENTWKSHFSYEKDVEQLATGNSGEAFAVIDGKLFKYDAVSGGYDICFRQDRGNDKVMKLAYNSLRSALLIVRENNKMDVMTSDKTFYSVQGLDSSNPALNKKVNDIFMLNNVAYVATNFGIYAIDIDNKTVRQTCFFNIPVYSITYLDNQFFAATSDGVYTIPEQKNIQDISEWKKLNLSSKYVGSVSFSDSEICKLSSYQDKLHFLVSDKGLYTLSDSDKVEDIITGTSSAIMVSENIEHLAVYQKNKIYYFSGYKSYKSYDTNNLITLSYANYSSGLFWVAFNGSRLSQIQLDLNGSSISQLKSNLRPNGPHSNYPFFMAYTGGKVRVVSGGYYLDNYNYPGQLSEWDNNSWFNYPAVNGGRIDFSNVISDPEDSDHLFVTSWGMGIYEYKSKGDPYLYNSSTTGGKFLPISGWYGFLRVNGLAFDKNGVLWTVGSHTKTKIYSFERKSGPWEIKAHYIPESEFLGTNSKSLAIDSYSNKWCGGERGDFPNLVLFNENGTLGDSSDDKSKVVSSFLDENGNRLDIERFMRMVEDKKKTMWICTNIGVFTIKVTEDLLDNDIRFGYAKTIDKGSGNLINLFENTFVRSVAIDRMNRKWFATDDLGLFLMDEDGRETIYNFTTENSCLPSNCIFDVVVDNDNDIVYVGTDKGMVSFKCTPSSASSREISVLVQPASMSVNGTKQVNIFGLKPNSYLKLADEKGNLVLETNAVKGEYLWNLKDNTGTIVTPGLYYIFGTDEFDKTGMVGTVSVTNE
ncbi:hypothetical protein [Dysgonomonas sp. 520]|uniref:type IX secretion system anionic LPS delivery protein PorZ n=1 Tax=Dysgonomonas sp. 520 TaxID=2302931 RepID=UPI001C881A7E|nr:hypothetical protein [Dysgonomonas sp. 520]